jgi:hypothetical protein
MGCCCNYFAIEGQRYSREPARSICVEACLSLALLPFVLLFAAVLCLCCVLLCCLLCVAGKPPKKQAACPPSSAKA